MAQPPPPTLEIEGETMWLLEKILKHKKGRKHEVFLKWQGYDHSNNSGELESSFNRCCTELAKCWDSVRYADCPIESNQSVQRVDQTLLKQSSRPESHEKPKGRLHGRRKDIEPSLLKP